MHITKGKADWIDVLRPTGEDLSWFKNRFGFNEMVLDELRSPSDRPRFDAQDNFIFLTHHFPIYYPEERLSKRAEVDFIITKHQVITVHYEKLEPLTKINVDLAQNSLDLSYSILGALMDFEARQLRHIKERLDYAGSQIFRNLTEEILVMLSSLKREIAEYNSLIRHQEPLLDSLLVKGVDFWGPVARNHINDLMRTNEDIIHSLENYRETLAGLENAASQMIRLRAAKTAKILMNIALLSAPLLLLVSISGIILGSNPIMDILWYFVGFVSVALTFAAIYIKKKRN